MPLAGLKREEMVECLAQFRNLKFERIGNVSKIIKIESDWKLGDTYLNEDDIKDVNKSKAIIDRLERHLKAAFPETSENEQAALVKTIFLQNIPTGGTGALTALVNWECVSVMLTGRFANFAPSLLGENVKRSQIAILMHQAKIQNIIYR